MGQRRSGLACILIIVFVATTGLALLIHFKGLCLFTKDVVSALLSVSGGVIAGLVVYFIIDYKEVKHWRGSKEKLIENLNITINAILSTVRTAAGFDTPSLRIASDEEYLQYIKSTFDAENNFGALKNALIEMEEGNKKTFLSNLYNMSEALKYMLTLFIGFRKADNWFVENIFKLIEKLYNASMLYYTFPEICEPKLKRKENIVHLEEIAIRNVVDLVDFAIKFKDQLNKR